MNSNPRFTPISFVLVVCALAPASRSHAQKMEFPPGVKLPREAPAAAQLPVGVSAFALEVDWTAPLLSASLIIGPPGATEPGARWDRVAPDDLKLQLSEAVAGSAPGSWKTALDTEIPEPLTAEEKKRRINADFQINPPPRPTAPSSNDPSVRVGGILPWFFEGARNDPDPVSPLGEGSARVAVRWVGRAAQWIDQPPALDFRDRFLMSSLDPLTGHGYFIIVTNRTAARLQFSFLSGWVKTAFPPNAWLAVHSMGPQSLVTMKDWRLAPPPDPPAIERAGAVLVLRKARAGDLVDFARVDPVRLRASSSQGRHLPGSAVSGLLWPTPLRPTLWMSRPPEDQSIAATFEIRLAHPRAVQMIRLIYPEAIGFSSHFNAGEIKVTLDGAERSQSIPTFSIKNPPGAYSTIALSESRMISGVILEFVHPSQLDAPSPARLAALQILGEL